jgi:molybdate transport system substrate-binding protein
MVEQKRLAVGCTLALKGVVCEVGRNYQDRSDVEVVAEFAPTKVLIERVLANSAADTVILTDAGAESLRRAGYLALDPIFVARSSLGIAVRPGAPTPDISSIDKFKTFLDSGPRLAYSKSGASGIYFAALVEQLGVSRVVGCFDIVDDGFTGERLLSGDADYCVQQISELLYVRGIGPILPFPDEVQQHAVFVGCAIAGRQVAEARRFISFLTELENRMSLASWGLSAA